MDPRFLMTIDRQRTQELRARAARARLAAARERRDASRPALLHERRRSRLWLRRLRRPRTA